MEHRLPTCIDKFVTYGNVVIITGWASDFQLHGMCEILVDAKPKPTLFTRSVRPDVAALYGPGSEHWGFRATCMVEEEALKAQSVGLRFSQSDPALTVWSSNPPVDDYPHALFSNFVNEVNYNGGVVLEIGSRARSGNTARERFNSNVEYIGLDVSPGPNVDVVGDAHKLPIGLYGSVDFVFSISTFEHFLMPWKVTIEINKVLKLGGKVFSHSHQAWPCHDEPWDFFRFSREAWSGLFNVHTGFQLLDARRGDAVSVVSQYNQGGSYDGLEKETGYAMSVCVAQTIGKSLVAWDENVNDVQPIQYNY